MSLIEKFDNLFSHYGYVLGEVTSHYHVYLLNQGMYHGAEIVMLDDSDSTSVKERFSMLGYSAIVQHFKDIETAESYLFKGFFNLDFTQSEINRRYEKFASNQISIYCTNGTLKYQYIQMPFTTYNILGDSIPTQNDLIYEVFNILKTHGAHLIIIEAAAGYGKTCTAYEVYKKFCSFNQSVKPIFAELFRNRDVKQFKYVLWSEIDNEKDTTVKQDVVIYNIRNGKIPLIIDGFDELLSKDTNYSENEATNEFEQVETMLSTIGDLLTDEAKIILTTRKTAIFSSDEFINWIESHNYKFDVSRFQLDKPNVKQWITDDKYKQIIDRNIPLEHISNPVLLSYLRYISDTDFATIVQKPESITDMYFDALLNREKIRQNLPMDIQSQMSIFMRLAHDFMELDISSESKIFIKDLIISDNKAELLKCRDLMPIKPTVEELADILANHALLDRVGKQDNIGFINEFVFGALLGKSLINQTIHNSFAKFDISENLLEIVISAFRYASMADRLLLWNVVHAKCESKSIHCRLMCDCFLLEYLNGTYSSLCIDSFNFENIIFDSKCNFVDVAFINVVFYNCTFYKNVFNNVSFTACKFKECTIYNETIDGNNINCYNCESTNKNFINAICSVNMATKKIDIVNSLDIKILGEYFKVDGKTTRTRYLSSISEHFIIIGIKNAMDVIDYLKKKNYIQIKGNNSNITQSGIEYYQNNRNNQ